MWQTYLQPQTLDDALALLAEHGANARLVAGGTDVVVELSRGIRPTATLIDITAIPGLRRVELADGDHLPRRADHPQRRHRLAPCAGSGRCRWLRRAGRSARRRFARAARWPAT